jgi:hypothetical protein
LFFEPLALLTVIVYETYHHFLSSITYKSYVSLVGWSAGDLTGVAQLEQFKRVGQWPDILM